MLLVQAGDSLTDVLRVVRVLWLQDELGNCLLGLRPDSETLGVGR